MTEETPNQASFTEKVAAAMNAAAARVVEEHRKQGRPLAVWRDGKAVFEMPPPADGVREESPTYYPANNQATDEKSGAGGT